MNTLGAQRLVPILGMGLIMVLAVLRMPADWSQPLDIEAPPELTERLVALLAGGETQGYVALLRESRPAGVLDVQVRDRDGRLIAAWPGPIAQQTWGPLTAPLQSIRDWGAGVVTTANPVPLANNGVKLGELVLFRLRGLYGVGLGFLLDVLMAVVAGLGMLGLLGARDSRADLNQEQGRVPATPGTVERLGLRIGPALDQAGLGVVMLDAQQQVRYLNHAACRLTGWTEEAPVNLSVYALIRLQPPAGEAEDFFAADALAPASRTINHSVLGRDGVSRALQLTSLRLRKSSGELGASLILLKDLAAQRAELTSLRQEAEFARRALDFLADGVVVTDRYGRIKRVNRSLIRMFAYAPGELEGSAISKLLPVPFLNEPSVRLKDYLNDGPIQERAKVVGWRKDATIFPVDLQVYELADEESAYLLFIHDRGERQRQDNLSMRLERLLDHAAEEIYIFDAHSLYLVEANRQARENLGYDQEQFSRMTPFHLAPGLDRHRVEQDFAALRDASEQQLAYLTEHRRADGSSYPVELRISFAGDEEPPVFVAMARDVTEQREAESRLEYLARHDALTGLPNRYALLTHLERLLDAPAASDGWVVYCLNLDQFRQINEKHAHAVGDEVLVEFARRVGDFLVGDDFLARMSADEFVYVASCAAADAVPQRAEQIAQAMREPIRTSTGELIQIGVSIGIARLRAGESSTEWLGRADQALLAAKRAGGQSWRLAEVDSE